MARRFPCFILAVVVTSTLAACGSQEDSDPSSPPQLSGVYRPLEAGPIDAITFSTSKDYELVPRGCAGGGCAEIGTYKLENEGRTLVLENVATRQTHTIALEVVTTMTTASASLTKSIGVRPLDLVDRNQELNKPGGSQLTDGRDKKLNDGSGNQLNSGSGGQLLEVVSQALMNGQQMQRAN